MRTVTLRIDDATYHLFHDMALADNRPLSNLIETAARKHMEECLFVDETEMHSIRENKRLVKRLKAGSQAAKRMQGRFID
jgi:hypothetical protein